MHKPKIANISLLCLATSFLFRNKGYDVGKGLLFFNFVDQTFQLKNFVSVFHFEAIRKLVYAGAMYHNDNRAKSLIHSGMRVSTDCCYSQDLKIIHTVLKCKT